MLKNLKLLLSVLIISCSSTQGSDDQYESRKPTVKPKELSIDDLNRREVKSEDSKSEKGKEVSENNPVFLIEDNEENTLKIYAGSCNDQEKDQSFWNTISAGKPDVWLWIGDNIYADNANYEQRKKAYDFVKAQPGYQQLMSTSEIFGTWDDHDYGNNNAGSEYSGKDESKKAHLKFFEISEDHEVWQRPGIYRKHSVKKNGVEVDIILLDTRYFKQSRGDNQTMLGHDQWLWLEEIMKDGKETYTIIVSGVQMLTDDTSKESWERITNDKNRLIELVSSSKRSTLLLSGDKHYAELSKLDQIVEVTTSGLTHSKDQVRDNSQRILTAVTKRNFGEINIKINPDLKVVESVSIKIRDVNQGTVLLDYDLSR